jgi:putative transcriptional regulator
MPVRVKLDLMLVRRKVTSRELAKVVGMTESNLSLLKSGKVKGVRFATLAAICRHLECVPGDILDYDPSDEDLGLSAADVYDPD